MILLYSSAKGHGDTLFYFTPLESGGEIKNSDRFDR